MLVGVTGANGFIGQHLCRQLEIEGHEVIKADLPNVDINDTDSLYELGEADIIYHLAVLPLKNCNEDYKKCIDINITGTANIMSLAKINSVKRVIYASASSVYGDPDYLPAHEHIETKPMTIYGMSKLAGENIIKILSDNFQLTHGIFRFTNVYGDGQYNGVIPTVINKILDNDEIKITGSGKQTRDFVHVNDVVKILIETLQKPLYSFVANLGSGTHISINDIVKMCSMYLAKEPIIKYIPAEHDRKNFYADTGFLKEIFGHHDFINFEDGLRDTVNWWIYERQEKRTSI